MAGGIEGLCNISCCFVWEEIKLRVFENRVRRRIFGPKRGKVVRR
jgi:hypothetical protein